MTICITTKAPFLCLQRNREPGEIRGHSQSLSPYASPIVVVPRKAPPGAPESEQKGYVLLIKD